MFPLYGKCDRMFQYAKQKVAFIHANKSEMEVIINDIIYKTIKLFYNCFLLDINKELTDMCNLQELAKEFVEKSDERRKYFGIF